jgi:hypothetical protein
MLPLLLLIKWGKSYGAKEKMDMDGNSLKVV